MTTAADPKKSLTLGPYLDCVKATLTAFMCLQNFGSQTVERHNKPEIESAQHDELMLIPITVARSDDQKVLIEGSINSVRVSVVIKKLDELEEILTRRLLRFLTQRAENFVILRRKPIPGYDISFLITNNHTEHLYKHKLVDFVIQFLNDIEAEVGNMKLNVNQRARIVAQEFLARWVRNLNNLLVRISSSSSNFLITTETRTELIEPSISTFWSSLLATVIGININSSC